MASIRILKKDINCLTEELIAECFVYQHFHPEVTDAKLFHVLEKLTATRNDLVEKINNAANIESAKERRAHLNSVHAAMPGLLDIMDDLKK
jgi:hypothetical protein